ncbi:AraC family transcriptional regulator [Amphritea sp.]|uniref:AraC family transcriptional regulator n=1 Tax=Amphritea sp. TaxID=1872502 RepID=UPI003D0C2218
MMFNEVLQGSAIYQAQDPQVISDYVNKHIGTHRISVKGECDQKASIWHRNLSDVALSRITYGGNVRVQSADLEDIYHLQIVTSGVCDWSLADKDLRVSAGEVLLLNPNDRVDLNYSADCEKVIVKIPKSVMISALAEKVAYLPKDGVKFDHAVRKTSDHRSLIHLLELIFMEAEAAQSDFSQLAPYSSLLAVKLLDCFSNNIQIPAEEQAPHCFSAIDSYIADHIKDDLSVDDLASLSRVSQRTLYNIFARHKSVTPMHYIKQQKLMHVHKMLQDGEGGCRNVTEVALDFGFMHLGRFSSEYRKMFGELPSETLKKRGH